MGRQVRFRLTDEEIARLETHLVEAGAIFLPLRLPSSDLSPRNRLFDPAPGGWGAEIIRAADLPRVGSRWVATPLAEPPSPGYSAPDLNGVPAIDFMRGAPPSDPDPRRIGRLHFMTSAWVGDRLVTADPQFVAWASSILNWVKRYFRYDDTDGLYVGS